jgi:succinoglycan biosynthesis transport protein ExoP
VSLREQLLVLRRRWPSVVTVALLAVLLTGAASLLATPTYRATASLFFSLDSAASANELAQGATFTRDQMASYATLATTPAVLDPVISRLELDTDVSTLAGQVSATAGDGTVILNVSVTHTSPEQAARIANTVAETLTNVVEAVGPRDGQSRSALRGTVVSPAATPRYATSPNTRLNVAAGLIAGLLLGVALAVLRENLDTRLRSVPQLRSMTDAPVLGQLTFHPGSASELAVQDRPHGPAAELYRQLRTNTQFLQVGGRPLAMVVTSSVAGEGKSTVAVNLALALAEVSDRVLLVDADLRRPSVAERLGIEGSAGLSTILIGRARFEDVVQQWGSNGLSVLTSGAVPPNPTALLSSEVMTALAAEIAERYDVVVYDTAPVLPVTDALVLSRVADGVVLVAGMRTVRRPQLGEALEAFSRVDARLLGLVVNKVPVRDHAGAVEYTPYVAAPRSWWRRVPWWKPETGAAVSEPPVRRVDAPATVTSLGPGRTPVPSSGRLLSPADNGSPRSGGAPARPMGSGDGRDR